MKKATCVYIIDPEIQEVLMAKKTRKVGVGYWFGYGGKIDKGESAAACTIRETYTETGGAVQLVPEDLEPVALIDFYNDAEMVPEKDDPSFRVLFYRVFQKKRTVPATDEMAEPTWFPLANIPWSELIAGDDLFIPQVLLGVPVKGWIHLSPDGKSVRASHIMPCGEEEMVV